MSFSGFTMNLNDCLNLIDIPNRIEKSATPTQPGQFAIDEGTPDSCALWASTPIVEQTTNWVGMPNGQTVKGYQWKSSQETIPPAPEANLVGKNAGNTTRLIEIAKLATSIKIKNSSQETTEAEATSAFHNNLLEFWRTLCKTNQIDSESRHWLTQLIFALLQNHASTHQLLQDANFSQFKEKLAEAKKNNDLTKLIDALFAAPKDKQSTRYPQGLLLQLLQSYPLVASATLKLDPSTLFKPNVLTHQNKWCQGKSSGDQHFTFSQAGQGNNSSWSIQVDQSGEGATYRFNKTQLHVDDQIKVLVEHMARLRLQSLIQRCGNNAAGRAKKATLEALLATNPLGDSCREYLRNGLAPDMTDLIPFSALQTWKDELLHYFPSVIINGTSFVKDKDGNAIEESKQIKASATETKQQAEQDKAMAEKEILITECQQIMADDSISTANCVQSLLQKANNANNATVVAEQVTDAIKHDKHHRITPFAQSVLEHALAQNKGGLSEKHSPWLAMSPTDPGFAGLSQNDLSDSQLSAEAISKLGLVQLKCALVSNKQWPAIVKGSNLLQHKGNHQKKIRNQKEKALQRLFGQRTASTINPYERNNEHKDMLIGVALIGAAIENQNQSNPNAANQWFFSIANELKKNKPSSSFKHQLEALNLGRISTEKLFTQLKQHVDILVPQGSRDNLNPRLQAQFLVTITQVNPPSGAHNSSITQVVSRLLQADPQGELLIKVMNEIWTLSSAEADKKSIFNAIIASATSTLDPNQQDKLASKLITAAVNSWRPRFTCTQPSPLILSHTEDNPLAMCFNLVLQQHQPHSLDIFIAAFTALLEYNSQPALNQCLMQWLYAQNKLGAVDTTNRQTTLSNAFQRFTDKSTDAQRAFLTAVIETSKLDTASISTPSQRSNFIGHVLFNCVKDNAQNDSTLAALFAACPNIDTGEDLNYSQFLNSGHPTLDNTPLLENSIHPVQQLRLFILLSILDQKNITPSAADELETTLAKLATQTTTLTTEQNIQDFRKTADFILLYFKDTNLSKPSSRLKNTRFQKFAESLAEELQNNSASAAIIITWYQAIPHIAKKHWYMDKLKPSHIAMIFERATQNESQQIPFIENLLKAKKEKDGGIISARDAATRLAEVFHNLIDNDKKSQFISAIFKLGNERLTPYLTLAGNTQTREERFKQEFIKSTLEKASPDSQKASLFSALNKAALGNFNYRDDGSTTPQMPTTVLILEAIKSAQPTKKVANVLHDIYKNLPHNDKANFMMRIINAKLEQSVIQQLNHLIDNDESKAIKTGLIDRLCQKCSQLMPHKNILMASSLFAIIALYSFKESASFSQILAQVSRQLNVHLEQGQPISVDVLLNRVLEANSLSNNTHCRDLTTEQSRAHHAILTNSISHNPHNLRAHQSPENLCFFNDSRHFAPQCHPIDGNLFRIPSTQYSCFEQTSDSDQSVCVGSFEQPFINHLLSDQHPSWHVTKAAQGSCALLLLFLLKAFFSRHASQSQRKTKSSGPSPTTKTAKTAVKCKL